MATSLCKLFEERLYGTTTRNGAFGLIDTPNPQIQNTIWHSKQNEKIKPNYHQFPEISIRVSRSELAGMAHGNEIFSALFNKALQGLLLLTSERQRLEWGQHPVTTCKRCTDEHTNSLCQVPMGVQDVISSPGALTNTSRIRQALTLHSTSSEGVNQMNSRRKGINLVLQRLLM